MVITNCPVCGIEVRYRDCGLFEHPEVYCSAGHLVRVREGIKHFEVDPLKPEELPGSVYLWTFRVRARVFQPDIMLALDDESL